MGGQANVVRFLGAEPGKLSLQFCFVSFAFVCFFRVWILILYQRLGVALLLIVVSRAQVGVAEEGEDSGKFTGAARQCEDIIVNYERANEGANDAEDE